MSQSNKRYCIAILVLQALLLAQTALSEDGCYPVTSADLQDPQAPKFEQFRVQVDPVTPASVDLKSHPLARTYRTVLRRGAAGGPNFAGTYSLVPWGCGTCCVTFALVNAKSGKVIFPKGVSSINMDHFDSDDFAPDGNTGDGGLRYRLDSRLLILLGAINEDEKREGAFYFIIENDDLKPLFSTKVRKRNCELGHMAPNTSFQRTAKSTRPLNSGR